MCNICNIGKQIKSFYKKHAECNYCNSKRGLKRYHDNRDKMSTQRKL